MHDFIFLMQTSPVLFILTVGVLSLIIGSFLNVVIARLPAILERDWRTQCYDLLDLKVPVAEQADIKKNYRTVWGLFFPLSHCPRCNTMIKPYDNIPIISYILLRGKCRKCKKHISIQYPFVEALTCIAAILVAIKYGATWKTVGGCLLTYILIAQSMIDYKHTIIPDELTLPGIWIGLLFNLYGTFTDLPSAVIGAISGYLFLWSIYWIFYIVTKKDGMGYGDFKLVAMLGAWLGWQFLPFTILASSLIGSFFGIGFILWKHLKFDSKRIPFGPFIAIAGWFALMYGPEINAWYINFAGLY